MKDYFPYNIRMPRKDIKLVELTDQENTTYNLNGDGLQVKEIAERMGITYETVKSYMKSIKVKLGLQKDKEVTAHFWRTMINANMKEEAKQMKHESQEIIEKILEVLDIKAPTFASNIGVTYQRIYDIQRGKTKRISTELGNKITSIYPQLNLSWVLTGEGEMLESDKTKYNEARMVDPDFAEVIKIPVKCKAGYLSGYNDETFLKEMPVVLVQVDKTFHGKYRCFEVEGDSMNDGTLKSICDGDTILCREVKRDLWCYKLHYNQWLFVINHVDGLLIKQIVDHDVEKGTITCHSLNPIYGEDFVLNLNEVRELYNVIKITDRNLKL